MASQKQVKPQLEAKINASFRPGAPIDIFDLFSGRTQQLRRALDAINQTGQHVTIYGERGVGKTSLANIVHILLKNSKEKNIVVSKINCDTSDNFTTIWKKVFSEIKYVAEKHSIGFSSQVATEVNTISDLLPKRALPSDVFKILRSICSSSSFVAIIDEFDRCKDEHTNKLLTDTLKMMSDNSLPATIIIVGVADVVDELINEHKSIDRALVQIQMPRMGKEELKEILVKGFKNIGFGYDENIVNYIVYLSQGLPHYTHLLGLISARLAADYNVTHVKEEYVEEIVQRSIQESQQSIVSLYHKSISSPRKDNLFSDVLLACAIVQGDQLGFFAAGDLRNPIKHITGKTYEIPAFARNLSSFCDSVRGPVLTRFGQKHRYRYRFESPLLQPFVIMNGIANKKIDKKYLTTKDGK